MIRGGRRWSRDGGSVHAGSGARRQGTDLTSCRINETDMNTDDGILEELEATIERLRSRMTQHEEHVGGHETRTRVILIDPLLRSLGWDPEDPEIVVHE